MFLGLGTSALAIVKVPYNISIIMTPVCIVLGGIANIWSYHILGDLYETYKSLWERYDSFPCYNT